MLGCVCMGHVREKVLGAGLRHLAWKDLWEELGSVCCPGSLPFSWLLSSFLANSCRIAFRVCLLTLLTLNCVTPFLLRGMVS